MCSDVVFFYKVKNSERVDSHILIRNKNEKEAIFMCACLEHSHLCKNFNVHESKLIKYLTYLEDKENTDCSLIKNILKSFIKSLSNYKEFYFFYFDEGEDRFLIYNVDKNFYEELEKMQKSSILQEKDDYVRISPQILGKLNECKFCIKIVNSEHIIFSMAKIKDYVVYNHKIMCTSGKNNSNEIHIKGDGNMFVYQNQKKYYPITLKTISWFSKLNPFFYELFCSFFKTMGESYPLYKDLYRNFKQNISYIYCSLRVNEAKEYGSYQQWLLGHYKTVSNVPKSINKERLNIAVFKALACRYVEENHQQKIYKMKVEDNYMVLSQNDIFCMYYQNKFDDLDQFGYQIVKDYVSMMIYLRRKINICTNSYSKLKQAHNDIIDPYMQKKQKSLGKSKMTIPKKSPFRKLKLPDDFEIIKNGKRLYVEGYTMHHCVYSYRERVNKGHCVIVHLTYKENPYTLEIVCRAQTYRCVQMYGKWDSVAPKEAWDYVKDVLKKKSEILKK